MGRCQHVCFLNAIQHTPHTPMMLKTQHTRSHDSKYLHTTPHYGQLHRETQCKTANHTLQTTKQSKHRRGPTPGLQPAACSARYSCTQPDSMLPVSSLTCIFVYHPCKHAYSTPIHNTRTHPNPTCTPTNASPRTTRCCKLAGHTQVCPCQHLDPHRQPLNPVSIIPKTLRSASQNPKP